MMGQEARCLARIGEHHVEVKALLESDELILRGEQRRRLPFATLDGVEAADGRLTLELAGETIVLELGPIADRWARKIRNPPTLLDKLGVKAGQRVAIIGLSDASLRADLVALTAVVEPDGGSRAGCVDEIVGSALDLVFAQADAIPDLDALPALRRAIAQDGAVWVVHPKGRADLKDVHVIAAGRAAGLVDNKVARISDRYSALRFVIPRAQRVPAGSTRA
jgi:hypothetical protein